MTRRRLVHLPGVPEVEGYEWANERWLRRRVEHNELRHYKAAGKVLIDLDDIDAFVEGGRREPVGASQ